jgi:hypothetical protein
MSITNQTKASESELWSTIPTTWGSETRTWLECVSLMENADKLNYAVLTWAQWLTTWADSVTHTWQMYSPTYMSNTSLDSVRPIWNITRSPWTESSPWADTISGITNQSKP